MAFFSKSIHLPSGNLLFLSEHCYVPCSVVVKLFSYYGFPLFLSLPKRERNHPSGNFLNYISLIIIITKCALFFHSNLYVCVVDFGSVAVQLHIKNLGSWKIFNLRCFNISHEEFLVKTKHNSNIKNILHYNS